MMIVKIGGGAAIDHQAIAADLASLSGPMVLVHGANAARDQLAEQLNKPKRVVTSLSGFDSVFADEDALDVMMMAYSGLVNKRLVACLRQHGIDAVGLSGIDGGLVTGRRNRGIRTRENGKKVMLRDFSGKPEQVNVRLLQVLLEEGYTPVITVPILDETGVPVSTENDDVVALLQKELKADQVVQLIEAPGLLRDPADPESLVSQVSFAELNAWQERVSGRMKRKIMALNKLFQYTQPQVYIADGRTQAPISAALAGSGTCIQ